MFARKITNYMHKFPDSSQPTVFPKTNGATGKLILVFAYEYQDSISIAEVRDREDPSSAKQAFIEKN